MDHAIALIIYWGVWLLIPIVVDGITTLYTLIGVSLVHLQNARNRVPPLQSYPLVSIIIADVEVRELCGVMRQIWTIDRKADEGLSVKCPEQHATAIKYQLRTFNICPDGMLMLTFRGPWWDLPVNVFWVCSRFKLYV